MSKEPEFYRDFGRPDVERLSRAVCIEQNLNPDDLVAETGYSASSLVPRWWKYQFDALKFIAMTKASFEPARSS